MELISDWPIFQLAISCCLELYIKYSYPTRDDFHNLLLSPFILLFHLLLCRFSSFQSFLSFLPLFFHFVDEIFLPQVKEHVGVRIKFLAVLFIFPILLFIIKIFKLEIWIEFSTIEFYQFTF